MGLSLLSHLSRNVAFAANKNETVKARIRNA